MHYNYPFFTSTKNLVVINQYWWINILHCNHDAFLHENGIPVIRAYILLFYSLTALTVFFSLSWKNNDISHMCIGGNICYLWHNTLIIETLATQSNVYTLQLKICIFSVINSLIQKKLFMQHHSTMSGSLGHICCSKILNSISKISSSTNHLSEINSTSRMELTPWWQYMYRILDICKNETLLSSRRCSFTWPRFSYVAGLLVICRQHIRLQSTDQFHRKN